MKIDIKTEGNLIVITERDSQARIATLEPGKKSYTVDQLAWTANLFAPSPIDVASALPAMLSPMECRLIAATPCTR